MKRAITVNGYSDVAGKGSAERVNGSTVENNIEGRRVFDADQSPAEIFAPEDLTDEHRMKERRRANLSIRGVPNLEAIKADWRSRASCKKEERPRLLAKRSPKRTAVLVLNNTVVIAEMMGRAGGFGTTFGADSSIGLLPILYFGSEELKRQWLPRIVSGEVVSAYCLTESGSGSDALGAKTTARLVDGGKSYVLNGEKMFIYNGACRCLHSFLRRSRGKEKFRVCRRANDSCRSGSRKSTNGKQVFTPPRYFVRMTSTASI